MESTNLNLIKRNEESINNHLKKSISSMVVAGSLILGVNSNAQSNEVLMSSINNQVLKSQNNIVKVDGINYKDSRKDLIEIGSLIEEVSKYEKLYQENPNLIKKRNLDTLYKLTKETTEEYMNGIKKHSPDLYKQIQSYGENAFAPVGNIGGVRLAFDYTEKEYDDLLKQFPPIDENNKPTAISYNKIINELGKEEIIPLYPHYDMTEYNKKLEENEQKNSNNLNFY